VSNYSFLVTRQIASEGGANPGILDVDLSQPYATGPFACQPPGSSAPQSSDVYMYGSGLQSPTNDYNISPGQPNSAWKVAATQIPGDCPGGVSAIAGGPSGFGQFEGTFASSTPSLQYRPFDSATGQFDEPVVTVDSGASAATVGLSQDGNGDIYATGFLQQQYAGPTGPAASGAPLALFYSSDGGKTWQGPGSLESTIQPGFERSESAVGADGKGWLVITAAGSLYALEFSAADAANSFSAQVAKSPPVAGGSVTLSLSCFAIPCTVDSSLISAAAGAARTTHPASKLFGVTSVRITRHGVQKVKIRLLTAGAAALKKHRGRLAALLTESTLIGPYREEKTVRVTLTEIKRRSRRSRR
jgi:hypothetical protein